MSHTHALPSARGVRDFSKCREKKFKAYDIYYKPNKGSRGNDEVKVRVRQQGYESNRIVYKIRVR